MSEKPRGLSPTLLDMLAKSRAESEAIRREQMRRKSAMIREARAMILARRKPNDH